MSKAILLGLVSVGLLALAGCGQENGQEMEEATARRQETIALEGDAPIVLEVRNGVGTIVLGGADIGAIEVDYTLTAYGNTGADAERELGEMRVTFTQEAGRMQIYAVQPKRTGQARSNKVDLTITVPRTMDLIVQNGVGDIDARDLRAPDRLHVSGGVGNITLTNIDAGPDTVIKSDVGDVRFEGALADEGSAKITTDVGKVIVRLPENAGAKLEASTEVGSIAMRGLMASDRNLKKNIPGAMLTATLGTGGPSLTLAANVGDITLEQR